MSRRPRRIYHRGHGRARWGILTWLQFLGMLGAVLLFVGYVVWLFFIQPATASPAHVHIFLPVVMR